MRLWPASHLGPRHFCTAEREKLHSARESLSSQLQLTSLTMTPTAASCCAFLRVDMRREILCSTAVRTADALHVGRDRCKCKTPPGKAARHWTAMHGAAPRRVGRDKHKTQGKPARHWAAKRTHASAAAGCEGSNAVAKEQRPPFRQLSRAGGRKRPSMSENETLCGLDMLEQI